MNVIATATTDLEEAAAVFAEARPRMFQVAFRTLGSVSDAEDIVQEAWLKWQQTDRAVVRHPAAFLATTTSRLAINTAVSARRRHETSTDPQVLGLAVCEAEPGATVEQDQAVGRAMLILLQRLTPKERAAYMLREAFDYPYPQIAELLQITAAYARQLVLRARKSITERPSRLVSRSAHRNLMTAFRAAARSGELGMLEELLAAEATS